MSAILGIGGGVGIVLGRARRRASRLALAVLAAAGRHRRRRVLHLALHSGVAGARPRPRQLAAAALMSDGHLGGADRDQRDADLGLELGEDARTALRGARALRRLGVGRVAQRGAPDRHDDDAVRGVWTANLIAFLLGAGMYSMFFVFPQFAQLPTSTGFGFGASVVVSGLYLLPSTLGVFAVSAAAGAVARRWGSRTAVIVGSAVTAVVVPADRRPARVADRHARERRPARDRDRALVRRARQPRGRGGAAGADRRRRRDEHGHAHHRRRARRSARRHAHRRPRRRRRAAARVRGSPRRSSWPPGSWSSAPSPRCSSRAAAGSPLRRSRSPKRASDGRSRRRIAWFPRPGGAR